MSEADVAHETREEARGRRLTTEEMVRIQLDRINTIRSDIEMTNREAAWSECNEALFDLLLPWWTDDVEWLKKWEDRPCAVVTTPEGVQVPAPTAQDCRAAQLLIMELLHKNNMMVKTRTTSGPPKRDFTPKPATVVAPSVPPVPEVAA